MTFNNHLDLLLNILERVNARITDDSNVVWTRYDTPVTLHAELVAYMEQLRGGNTACLEQLKLLFAPTGSLQEHAISNGWANEYIQWSAIFDINAAAISRLRKKMR